MYVKNVYRMKHAIEIEEFHSDRFRAPGMKRQKKQTPTPEQMEKANQRQREKVARRRLRNNFDTNDYFTRLSYIPDQRPETMQEAKEDFAKFIRIVRREYRKRGAELKWMRNIEVGKRGAWHVHLVINRIPDTDIILAKAWTKGQIQNKLLYQDGEFCELAQYITKTPKTDPRQVETDYSCSRNLPVPEPERHEYRRRHTWKEVKPPKGWYLDEASYYEGTNPYTGYTYRTYALLEVARRQACTACTST